MRFRDLAPKRPDGRRFYLSRSKWPGAKKPNTGAPPWLTARNNADIPMTTVVSSMLLGLRQQRAFERARQRRDLARG
jgi:hypothetical protein